MLKLMKYEIKNSLFEVIIANLVIILSTFFLGIAFAFKQMILTSLLIGILSLCYFAAFVILLILIIKSFHTKLFTKEGYLTFTIPVSLHKLIISKILVNILWVLITCFIFLVSILYLFFVIFSLSGEGNFISSLLFTIGNYFSTDPFAALSSVFLFFIQSLTSIVLMFCILFFVLSFTNCGIIRKGKFMIGVLLYIAINSFLSIITTITYLFNFKINFLFGNYTTTFDIINFIISVLFCFTFYFLSYVLIQKSLELE